MHPWYYPRNTHHMSNKINVLGKFFVFLIVLTVSVFVGSAASAALVPLQQNIVLSPALMTSTAFKSCQKACATDLVACFKENTAALTAPVSPLDVCRSKANSCVTACNVTGFTTSCEDRCATVLQGCMVVADASGKQENKTACHVSNKACLLKACAIPASALSLDYCSRQCTRGYNICSVDGGMAGVNCTTMKTACSVSCPAVSASTLGLLGADQSTMQLRTSLDARIASLRSLSVNLKAFDLSLRRLSAATCPTAVLACEQTYKSCLAKSSSFDQVWDQRLFEAKNECIQTCGETPDSCFGLTKHVCQQNQKKSCSCPNGASGMQSCKTDGSAYGDCQCEQVAACASGEKRECICVTGASGVQGCLQDGTGFGECTCTVSSLPATSPVQGCVAGQVISASCMMATGAPGVRQNTCDNSGNWVSGQCAAAVAPTAVCTSWDYSAWNACSAGSQVRSATAAYPSGCVGGSPELTRACEPPGPDYCYRGVAYRFTAEGLATAKCVGSGQMVDGKNCLLNVCPPTQGWMDFGAESGFKRYVDAIYSQTIPNSCNPSFVYTQCPAVQ